MNNMDIIVHPSMAEGFSRSVLEAMALSKVVIASGIGGERETIIDGENGYIINPVNTEEIAKKLIMLYRNYSLVKEIGNNALSTIKQKHLIEDKINKDFEVEVVNLIPNSHAKKRRDYVGFGFTRPSKGMFQNYVIFKHFEVCQCNCAIL